jgi:hypothetical protein
VIAITGLFALVFVLPLLPVAAPFLPLMMKGLQ